MRISGEWELDPTELSGLFQAKGWCYHTEDGLIIPSAKTIDTVLAHLVEEALDARKDEVQGGRFMIWKDPELPNSYDLWLNVGFIWDEDALSGEEKSILGQDEEENE
ncbi:hypothetical protein SAMN05216275_10513 [Streptosporangium canum]|uniref:Uncharacterized protein n=1 Tax=Streptosporangium canum TaxID=324952 RepID=A0A1I3L4R5_9ACTN|nr:hypothetical protein [Streptosporangium canum]SFI79713.1 hypothetical protein SAMN05216275_10513 [Streptosporangium canum]